MDKFIILLILFTALSCTGAEDRSVASLVPQVQQKTEKNEVNKGLQECDVKSTGFKARKLKSPYERYNQDPGIPLRCIPSEAATQADTLNSIFRLDVLEHGEVDSVAWCRVRTFSLPHRTGWIKSSEFTRHYVKATSSLTFVSRAFPPPNEYYSGHVEIYEIVRGEIFDTLTIDKVYGSDHRLSLVKGHILENVRFLLRYESHDVSAADSYYQDIIAYVNGDFIPLLYTDNVRANVDTADIGEYTIYLPNRTREGEVILAPLFEHRSEVTEKERIDKKFSFSDDISIPIDQCVIKFYERATPLGKLKYRSTEVFHWNGDDFARMYGNDFNFEDTK